MFTRKIPRNELNIFYQSKFDYFRKLSFLSAMLTGLLEITYFVSDCQIFGRFAAETIIPRCSVILPLILLAVCERRITDYKYGVFLYYMVAHASMWATIWAIWYLPNKDFAREGFIIMHFAFMAIGLGMPVVYHIPIHSLVILNIIISNMWNHYEHFNMMISLAVPVFIGIIFIMLILENSYADQYLIKKELEKTSITDNLTEAFNRNKINEIISDDETEQLNIPQSSDIVVLMIDIDKFKRVNDSYGHDAGDKVLVFLAEQIKRCIRSSDMLIRWGGEEFVVFLVGAEMEVGLRIAEHIRHSVEHTENEVCPITISVGVSRYDGGNYRDAVRKADRALYYAKGHGRNLVVHYDDIADEDLKGYKETE